MSLALGHRPLALVYGGCNLQFKERIGQRVGTSCRARARCTVHGVLRRRPIAPFNIAHLEAGIQVFPAILRSSPNIQKQAFGSCLVNLAGAYVPSCIAAAEHVLSRVLVHAPALLSSKGLKSLEIRFSIFNILHTSQMETHMF